MSDELVEDIRDAGGGDDRVEVLRGAIEEAEANKGNPAVVATILGHEVISAAASLEHEGLSPDLVARLREVAPAKRQFDKAMKVALHHLEKEQERHAAEAAKALVCGYERDALEVFEEIEGFRLVMTLQGKYAVRMSPTGVMLLDRVKFLSSFGNHKRPGKREGNTVSLAAIYWDMEEGKPKPDGGVFSILKGLVFAPSGVECPEDWFNLWTGFAVEPTEGPWPMIEWHLCNVIAGGDERVYKYILRWFALSVQTGGMIPVVLVLRGEEGSGKGLFFEDVMIRRIWGVHGMRASKVADVVGQFNDHLERCRFMFVDDTFFSGSHSETRALKNLTGGSETIFNGKNQPLRKGELQLAMVIASNDEQVVRAGVGDRRYMVSDTVSFAALMSPEETRVYRDRFLRAIDGGEAAAFLHHLLDMDVLAFNVHYDRPVTAAYVEQKERSLEGLTAFWHELLLQGELKVRGAPDVVIHAVKQPARGQKGTMMATGSWGRGGMVSGRRLHELYEAWRRAEDAKRHGGRGGVFVTANGFLQSTRRVFGTEVLARERLQIRTNDGKSRERFYRLKPLAAMRGDFLKATGIAITHDDFDRDCFE